MSAALDHQQHRGTDAACGGHAITAMRRLASAHQFQPAESKAAVTQRLRAVATNHSRLSFELRGGRFSHRRQVGVFLLPHIRPVASTSRGWCVTPADILPIRTRTYAGLTAEQVAALLNPVDHLPCRDIDLPERHYKSLSKSLVVYGTNHSEEPTHAAGSITQGRGYV